MHERIKLYSLGRPHKDPFHTNDPDWVPSINMEKTKCKARSKRKKARNVDLADDNIELELFEEENCEVISQDEDELTEQSIETIEQEDIETTAEESDLHMPLKVFVKSSNLTPV